MIRQSTKKTRWLQTSPIGDILAVKGVDARYHGSEEFGVGVSVASVTLNGIRACQATYIMQYPSGGVPGLVVLQAVMRSLRGMCPVHQKQRFISVHQNQR